MAPKSVTPQFGAASFSCPHCGALADQSWSAVFEDGLSEDKYPRLPDKNLPQDIRNNTDFPESSRENAAKFFERELRREVFVEKEDGKWLAGRVINLFLSECYSCRKVAVWRADGIMWPDTIFEIAAHEDMPPGVKADFDEAGSIFKSSSRGAAALLRLSIQKLVMELGGKGDNLNSDIGQLVADGKIDRKVQRALDVVRVVGNSAVHPGQIDLKDDSKAAVTLFRLVNIVVETAISAPKHIDAVYEALPDTAKQQIAKRDADK